MCFARRVSHKLRTSGLCGCRPSQRSVALKLAGLFADRMSVESRRSPGVFVDVAVGLYVLAAGVVLLFALAWTLAPFENTEPNTAWELAQLGLAVIGLATAAAMARAFWGGNSRDAGMLFLVSLLSFTVWAVVIGG